MGGLLSALKLIGGTLSDHTFLFLGAGEVSIIYIFLNQFLIFKQKDINALLMLVVIVFFSFVAKAGTGIAELISLEILKKVNNSMIFFV